MSPHRLGTDPAKKVSNAQPCDVTEGTAWDTRRGGQIGILVNCENVPFKILGDVGPLSTWTSKPSLVWAALGRPDDVRLLLGN